METTQHDIAQRLLDEAENDGHFDGCDERLTAMDLLDYMGIVGVQFVQGAAASGDYLRQLGHADAATSAGVRLYGFGARGTATWPPGTDRTELGADSPVPLYLDQQTVQDAIDAQNAEHGTGSLHVIIYEVQS